MNKTLTGKLAEKCSLEDRRGCWRRTWFSATTGSVAKSGTDVLCGME